MHIESVYFQEKDQKFMYRNFWIKLKMSQGAKRIWFLREKNS